MIFKIFKLFNEFGKLLKVLKYLMFFNAFWLLTKTKTKILFYKQAQIKEKKKKFPAIS